MHYVSQKGRDHLEDVCVYGKIILEWTLGKQGGEVWTVFIRLRIGTSGGSCEHGNESSSFIKDTLRFLTCRVTIRSPRRILLHVVS
jgi:hypothetical protein